MTPQRKTWDTESGRYVDLDLAMTTFGPLGDYGESVVANDNVPVGLTAERVRQLFHYDPDTGIFTRRISVSPNARAGDLAGSYDMKGYLTIRVDGRSYKAHRLAWLYMTGTMPDEDIDHKNLKKDDNRFKNLRVASDAENLWNLRVRPDNQVGMKGAHVHKRKGVPTGLFRARIRTNGRTKHIGYFKTPEEASDAYAAAARNEHGEFARAS